MFGLSNFIKRIFNRQCSQETIPDFACRPKEQNIKSCEWLLNDNKRKWIVVERIKGLTATYAIESVKPMLPFMEKKTRFFVCDENGVVEQKHNSVYWRIAYKYRIEDCLKRMLLKYDYVVIRGTIIGNDIDENKYSVPNPEFYVSDIWYPDEHVKPVEANAIADLVGLCGAPILVEDLKLASDTDKLVGFFRGLSAIANTERAGVVFKSKDNIDSFEVTFD